VRRHHGVAQEDQHQRRGDHDAERRRDGDRGEGLGRRDAGGGQLRRDRTGEHSDARTHGPVHRREERADADRRNLRRDRPAADEPHAGAEEDIGEGQAIEQRPHQHEQGQGLQQVVLEQVDETGRHRLKERGVAAEHGRDSADPSDADQHDEGGQPGEDQPGADERHQREAEIGHLSGPRRRRTR
jgi:hypothetical protein